MANSDKDIVITPNRGSTTADPKIVFSGASSTLGPQNITAYAYPTNNGTVSFEGSAGQLFSITNSLTGTIFSVNDISGIPSIDVNSSGLVRLTPCSGSTTIGTYCNTSIGLQSLLCNTTGNNNASIGYQSLMYNTIGSNNISVGYQALERNSGNDPTCGIPCNNIALGYQALRSNSIIGTFGTIVGGSGYTNGSYYGVTLTLASGTAPLVYPKAAITVSGGAVTGITVFEFDHGAGIVPGTFFTAPSASIGGTGSGFCVPVATIVSGSNNFAAGYQALYNLSGDSTYGCVGENNVGIGYKTQYCYKGRNLEGGLPIGNISIGCCTLYNNLRGRGNIALGDQSLQFNTADDNIALGYQSLLYNTAGKCNIALGHQALERNSGNDSTCGIPCNNIALGYQALRSNSTIGTFGTIVGGSGYTNGTYYGVSMTLASGTAPLCYPKAKITVSGGAVTGVDLYGQYGWGSGVVPGSVFTAPSASIGGTGSGFCVPVATIRSGSNNFAAGYQALYNLSGNGYYGCVGDNHIAIGFQSQYCYTGDYAGGYKYGNIAIGCNTLRNNNYGAKNIAIGGNALSLCCITSTLGGGCIQCAGYNIAIGENSLQNSVGGNNVAVGHGVLSQGISYVAESLFIGNCAGCTIAYGFNNAVVGNSALKNSFCTACGVTAIGHYAMFGGLNGCVFYGTAIGKGAMSNAKNSCYDVAIGKDALCMTACCSYGNVGVGACALRGPYGGGITCFNVAVGFAALKCNAGSCNIAIGLCSSALNNTGSCNVAIGSFSLYCNTTGISNIAIGSGALYCSTYGNLNVAIGSDALRIFNGLGNNVAIGTVAGFCVTTGGNNTIIGSLTGTPGLVCTVLIGAGSCERIKVDDSGLCINGSPFTTPGSATPTSQGLVYARTPAAFYCDVALGYNAGNVIGTSYGNVAMGYGALKNSNSKFNNVAIGHNAGFCGAAGFDSNVVIGYCAGYCIGCTGSIGIGTCALGPLRSGFCNIAIGHRAMSNSTNTCIVSKPYGNVAIGNNSLINIHYGLCNRCSTGNVAIGQCTGRGITFECCNTIVGACAGNAGACTVAIGSSALSLINPGCTGSVAVGAGALSNYNGYGSPNLAVGYQAGFCLTTGNGNTIVGICALRCSTTTVFNVAVGYGSLLSLSSGTRNTALGPYTLFRNTSGSCNVAVGYGALCCTFGNANVAIGTRAGCCNLDGCNNVAIGTTALFLNLTGCNNVAVGMNSLCAANSVTGNNIAIGFCAGSTITTGIANLVIGHLAQPLTATSSNQIVIGTTAYTTQYAPSATWTALSDARDKIDVDDVPIGLEFIQELRPVKFTWHTRDGNRVGLPDSGFLAQDLLELSNKYGVNDWLKIATDENPDKLHADPGRLIPVIVKAIQELATENITLRSRVSELENKIIKLIGT